jgi:hypothetical protein
MLVNVRSYTIYSVCGSFNNAVSSSECRPIVANDRTVDDL